MLCSVGSVTFLRALAGGAPRGEWDEYRFCPWRRMSCRIKSVFGDDEVGCKLSRGDDKHRERVSDTIPLEAVVMFFVKARDMARCERVCVNFALKAWTGEREGNREAETFSPFCWRAASFIVLTWYKFCSAVLVLQFWMLKAEETASPLGRFRCSALSSAYTLPSLLRIRADYSSVLTQL
jgi:hypothetical protein